MRTLPRNPYQIRKKAATNLVIRGLNLTDDYADGAIADSLNFTSDRYPYIATKPDREYTMLEHVSAITTWGDLVYVQDGNLFFKGSSVGHVGTGDKQFVMLHKYLVIWPNKQMLDTVTGKLINMEASVTGSEAKFTRNSVRLEWGVDLTEYFYAGDTLSFSGFEGALNAGEHAILEVREKELFFVDDTVTEGNEVGIFKIERKIPDLDYICESGNRLWGCSNLDQTIYVSKLDDPMNFFDYSGNANDAYSFPVSSEGDFTACVKLGSAVLFWKNRTLHKILGSMPEEYQLYTYDMEGIPEGCNKSVQVINEILYYVSTRGIYMYSGGSASYMSYVLGDRKFDHAVAGNDGDHYYVSVSENGKWSFLVYDLMHGIWMKQDDLEVVDFARVDNDAYMLLRDGKVYKENSDTYSADQKFMILFKPIFETTNGSSNRGNTAFGFKRHSKLVMRVEMGERARAICEVKLDDHDWIQVADIEAKQHGINPIVMPIDRCDKFQIRIRGNGKFAILGIQRNYVNGGDH